jgi:hypothetical protein
MEEMEQSMPSGSLKDLVPGDDVQIEKDLEWIDALKRNLMGTLHALQATLRTDAKHLSPSTCAIAFSRLQDAADRICQHLNENPLPESVADNVLAWLAPPIGDLGGCCGQLKEEAIAGKISGETFDRFVALTRIARGEIEKLEELVVFEKVSRRREQGSNGRTVSQTNQTGQANANSTWDKKRKSWKPKDLAKAKRISRMITMKRKDVSSIEEAAKEIAEENRGLRMTPAAIMQMHYRYQRYERTRNAPSKQGGTDSRTDTLKDSQKF